MLGNYQEINPYSLSKKNKLDALRASINSNGEFIIDKNDFTDSEILMQLDTIANQKSFKSNTELKQFAEKCMKDILFNFSDELIKEITKQKVYAFYGWRDDGNKLIPLDIKFKSATNGMYIYRKYFPKQYKSSIDNGALGYYEIFTPEEKSALKSLDDLEVIQDLVLKKIKLKKSLKQGFENKNISGFETITQIKSGFKNFKNGTKAFYKNRNNPLDDRWQIFMEFGPKEGFIYKPSHNELKDIFDDFFDSDFLNKKEEVEFSQILDWWLDNIIEKKENDGKKISYDAAKKVYDTYREILIVDDIAGCCYDW